MQPKEETTETATTSDNIQINLEHHTLQSEDEPLEIEIDIEKEPILEFNEKLVGPSSSKTETSISKKDASHKECINTKHEEKENIKEEQSKNTSSIFIFR